MVSPNSRTPGDTTVPCDFCTDRPAVLYCRSDAAKLCLLCDHHVHSANLLSRKHPRSQICDNCASAPAAARCYTDNLVLCQDCDLDAHAASPVPSSHDRSRIDGFSGCPSALELASLWGLDLADGDKKSGHPGFSALARGDGQLMQEVISSMEGWAYGSNGNGFGFQDLMVPSDTALAAPYPGVVKQGSTGRTNCGRRKQEMHKQLVELLNRDFEDNSDGGGGGGGDNLVPRTPNRTTAVWPANGEGICGEHQPGSDGVDAVVMDRHHHQPFQQQPTFTSLLMFPTQRDLEESGRGVVGAGTSNIGGQSTQVWILIVFSLGLLHC